jgi:hypothetical protein
MHYLFDPRSGQFRGKFNSLYGSAPEDENDHDRRMDYLGFYFEDVKAMPELAVEGMQFYTRLANVYWRYDFGLFETGWVKFDVQEDFLLTVPSDRFEESGLNYLADETGPLFGTDDKTEDLMSEIGIIEPTSCWVAAAKTLNFAIRAQAFLSGRQNGWSLDDACYFVLHTGRGKDDFYWECVFCSTIPESPYGDMFDLTDEEKQRLFLPAKETTWPGYTIITSLKQFGVLPWALISVKLIPNSFPVQQTVPVGYALHSYMAKNPETEPVARLLLGHLIRSLVIIHTQRIYHDLHDGFYGVAYNNLLERLWHNFAADAALGKLGICKQCGEVFEALSERKDQKQYCSMTCQENAKSARQYCRKKLREFLADKPVGYRPTIAEAIHATNNTRVNDELIDQVLKQMAAEREGGK